MLTIKALSDFGCDIESGIKRCANNEGLYLKLVKTIPSNLGFNNLYEALKNNNLDDAFSYAHGLKGIVSNLSLDPLLKPISELTEHLRNKDNIDYSKYISLIETKRKELDNLL